MTFALHFSLYFHYYHFLLSLHRKIFTKFPWIFYFRLSKIIIFVALFSPYLFSIGFVVACRCVCVQIQLNINIAIFTILILKSIHFGKNIQQILCKCAWCQNRTWNSFTSKCGIVNGDDGKGNNVACNTIELNNILNVPKNNRSKKKN